MRILFLNQYFPPDPAPTGMLLRQLGDFLVARGHDVEFISARQDYRGDKHGSRMLREMSALFSIFRQGIKACRADVIFSTTSPPCLLVIATLIALKHRARSVHWLMDMYPELALALGELPHGLLARAIGGAMGWAYRRAHLLVALDDDIAEKLQKYGVNAETVGPWVFGEVVVREPVKPRERFTWIYSGNLGRAHEWATLLDAQAILEKRGLPVWLRFQGGGPARDAAQARAVELGLRQCEWRDYAPEPELCDSLMQCDALAVTQRPETQGLLWPSKLALAMCLPRPILFVGPTDGAIARELRQFSHAGIFEPGDAEQVADWLGAKHAVCSVADAETYRIGALDRLARLIETI